MKIKFVTIAFAFPLWCLTALCNGQEEQVRMTMLLKGQYNSESPNSEYQCYVSDPDRAATVQSFRAVNTRNIKNGNINNPNPPRPTRERRAYPHWKVELGHSRNNGFGVFGCRANKPGRRPTNVTGVFMRSDADFIPLDGLFTQTVDIGKSDVSIVMSQRRSNPQRPPRWIKDGFLSKDNSNHGRATYILGHPANTNDAAAYGCFLNFERDDARHGIQLLIVRACPEGTWGSRCSGFCGDCYNGGICDEISGKCICAPGFKGDECQTACGGNRFGHTCEFQCSGTDEPNRCRYFLFCLVHPFGCRCNTGWKGLNCNEPCDQRTYGASCLQTCHCQSGQCNRYTGFCTGSTGCTDGWRGTNCQQVCGAGTFGANCREICHCLSGQCHSDSGECIGRPTGCSSGWRGSNCQEACGAGTFGTNCRETCHCLSGQCHSESGECTGRPTGCSSGWRGSNCQEALLTSAPEEVTKGSLSITISWPAWDGETNARDPPVIGYIPYHKNTSSTEWIPGSLEPVQTLNFTFSDLTPDTNYSFRVTVVREGNEEGPKSPELVVKTNCAVPSSPTNLTLETFKGEQDRLTISWQTPSSQDIRCSSGVTQLSFYYSNNKEPGREMSEDIIDVSNTSYTFNVSLEEGEYTFQLSMTTAGGESNKSKAIYHSITGFEPIAIVQWQSEQVTIYAEEKTATLFLESAKPRGRDVAIGLLSYGVGLTVHDDITIPETATIPEGKYVGSVNVSLNDDAVEGSSENGYRKVRIRLSEVLKGKASLGGYGYREIIDVNILGHATSETGYHSGSFRTRSVIANEDDGSAVLTLIVNEPFDEDLVIPYRVNLEWTGTTSHARHEVDYMYQVAHHEEMGYKHAILPAGERSLDIPFQLRDDDIPEDVEQFMVQINRDSLSHRINILTDTVIVDIVDNDRCPDTPGAQYYDGSCYFKVNLHGEVVISSDEAIHRCNDQGGYLAIIESEVENTIVSDTADLKQAWIGAIRDPDDQDTFIWSDGSSLVFDSWRQREPNNRLGNENCVKINYVRLGFWNDTPCQGDKQVRFGVCEKPAVASDSM